MADPNIKFELVARKVLSQLGYPVGDRALRFAACLEVCVRLYEDAEKYHRNQMRCDPIVGEIQLAAGALLRLLTDPRLESLKPLLSLDDRLLKEIAELISSSKRLGSLGASSIAATGLEADYIEAMQYEDHFKQRSPFEWMAGVYLPELYYLFIDNIGLSKGPRFIQFAKLVLKELKIQPRKGRHYSGETISKAGRLRATAAVGVTRRKNGPIFNADIEDSWDWHRHASFAVACGLRRTASIEAVARKIRKTGS